MLAERLQRGPSAPTELRPVTPEAEGSSPVAPVKYLQIGMFFRRFRGTTDGILGSRADPAEDPCLQVFSPSWARGRRRESRGAPASGLAARPRPTILRSRWLWRVPGRPPRVAR